MNLAVVVQRYGADINGGAELHARYIAERLARHAQVEVVTTCARDYVSWRNELQPGVETVNGVAVRRFPVTRERHPLDFGRRSRRVFEEPHSLADELAWLDSEGPTSPALIDYLVAVGVARSTTSSSSAIATITPGTARDGCRTRPSSCRRPNAIRPSACRSSGRCFAACAAIMYNSHEERAMIQNATAQRARSRRRRRRRLGSAGADGSGAIPAAAQDQPAVCDLHRTHRRQQGVRRALRLLPALRDDASRAASTSCSSASRSSRFRATTASITSGICPTRTSSTRWPPPIC